MKRAGCKWAPNGRRNGGRGRERMMKRKSSEPRAFSFLASYFSRVNERMAARTSHRDRTMKNRMKQWNNLKAILRPLLLSLLCWLPLEPLYVRDASNDGRSYFACAGRNKADTEFDCRTRIKATAVSRILEEFSCSLARVLVLNRVAKAIRAARTDIAPRYSWVTVRLNSISGRVRNFLVKYFSVKHYVPSLSLSR